MSLSQRKDGRWCVKFKSPEGQWRQRSFRSEEEARRFDDEQKYDAQADTPMTLRDCVTGYLLAHPELTHKSRWRYSFLVNGHNRKDGTHTEGPAEFLATKYCKDLDRRDLENLRAAMVQRGNKPVSMNAYVSSLRAALNWAASEDLIEENPWGKYRNPPITGRKSHLDGTMEDFRKVYEVLPAWAQWACRTCMALCLRPGRAELCALTWGAFDWQAKSVTVYMPKVGADKVVYPPESYLAEAWERYQAPRRHEYVCVSPRGGRMGYDHFVKTWGRARRSVGVKASPYSMRHIAASMMLAGGADMAAVAAQLGHANIATTATFYTHAVASAQRRAAAVNPMVHLVQLGAGTEGEIGH